MFPFLWKVVLGFCIFFSHFELSAAEPTWEYAGVEDGVVLHRGQVTGSEIVALKGSGIIEAPCWRIASILLDMKRAPEWVDSLAESRLVKRLSPLSYIEYNYINTPPIIMKDRDFVSLVTIEYDGVGKSFGLRYEPSDEMFSVPGKNPIRGQIIQGSFRLSYLDPERTHLRAVLQADPRGSVPKWVANFFQQSWPMNTFRALRVQAAKKDIVVPDAFADIIEKVRRFDLNPPTKTISID